MSHRMTTKKALAAAIAVPAAGIVGIATGAPGAGAAQGGDEVTWTDLNGVEHTCSLEFYSVPNNTGPNTLNASMIVPITEDDVACWDADANVVVTYRQLDSGQQVTQELRSARGWAEANFSNVADPADAEGNVVTSTHKITFNNCDSTAGPCSFEYKLTEKGGA